MSETNSEVYSIAESSAYSYQDLEAYQYSDDDNNTIEERPKKAIPGFVYDEEDEGGEWSNWNDYDNDSYVMHAYSDNDDDPELYQFSDEDLIPEEPDEDWLVAALLNNRPDFDHLELMLQTLEDFPRLMRAIRMNQIVKSVTVYEQFFDSIRGHEADKVLLAETICQIPKLEQLRVFYHSSYFVEPLERFRPSQLRKLCLMFFPDRTDKATLGCLTRILRDDKGRSACTNDDNTPAPTEESPDPSLIDSVRIRCSIMDDDFLQAIALGMEVNPTITTLSFWGNKVEATEKGEEESAKIDFYLRLNQGGIRDLHLLVNATPALFLEKIIEQREHLNLVFHLLQTNPSFLSYSNVIADGTQEVGDSMPNASSLRRARQRDSFQYRTVKWL